MRSMKRGMEEEGEPAEEVRKEQSGRRQGNQEDVVYWTPHAEGALRRKESSVLPNMDEKSNKMKFESWP